MSAVFKKTIETTGLNNDSQGEQAMLHALLHFADANHSGADVESNPYREVIRRFEAANLNPHAMVRIRQMLNSAVVAHDNGAIR